MTMNVQILSIPQMIDCSFHFVSPSIYKEQPSPKIEAMSIGSQSEIEIEIEIMKDMQPTLTYSAFPQAYTPAIKRMPRPAHLFSEITIPTSTYITRTMVARIINASTFCAPGSFKRITRSPSARASSAVAPPSPMTVYPMSL
ncbi:uncharacterized protein LOC120709122 [Panicum virgatum]|uniref:uncharacterized protein LOC120709122 n=1 Tax=Panicum virgatum TaxID=38727 RepID=UPI0019D58849|nr:uncharacterized protein LOC120709122 [Panicum virgatum]